MKALYLPADGRALEMRDVAPPARDGECRIRVSLAGICGTDLQILDGYGGFEGIPGHEFVGVVEEVERDADTAWIGQRVVGEINIGCGSCDWCRRGIKEHCPDRSVLGIKHRAGAFAECLWLPAANLFPVPDAIDDAAAVFVEPTAAACRILTQIDVPSGAEVVVLGDGRLGLLVGQVLATTGAQVTVVGKHEAKLEVARRLGLATQPRAQVNETSSAQRAEIVVDTTGRPDGLSAALRLVRPRGTVVLKSTFHGETTATLWPAVVDEVRVVGSRCGPFAPAIDLLATGRVRTTALVAGTFSLEDYKAAFERARRKLKILLKP